MKIKSERKYRVQHENYHLMNILEEEYYVELGVINLSTLKKFLKGYKVTLDELVDIDLLSEGIGKIIGDNVCDIYYQLNYLINLRLKNSTSKFILTVSTLKYTDKQGCEKYAPIFLIPFDVDSKTLELKKSDNIYINISLLQSIDDKNEETKSGLVNEYRNKKIYTISEMDKIALDIAKLTSSVVEPISYFTIASVEYKDFSLQENKMTPQRSIYETSESDIVERYFKETKCILPTNINQKNIILKAKDGENFSVDGRLGAGKTHTIINIIADAISNNKKVLYVNQDSDNIYDIEKNMIYLGLGNYTYNFGTNLKDIEKPNVEYDQNEIKCNPEVLKNLFDFQNQIQKRVHGYNIQTIFERLAVLKHDYPNIEQINIETDLESHEVSQIYKDLKKIENNLKNIDLYATNIWHRLEVAGQSISKEEIINRTDNFQKIHCELSKKIKKYCDKYQLDMPKNTNELYKMINYVYSFASVCPLETWKNEDVRRKVQSNLHGIQSFIDVNYNINKYYNTNINKEYQNGRMQEIFERIIGDHIKVNDKYETKDAIFFNRLIAKDNVKQNIISEIVNNSLNLENISHEVKEIFNLKHINPDANIAFTKMANLFNQFKWNRKIVDCYISNPGVFTKYAPEIAESYEIYNNVKIILPQHVNKFEMFTTTFLNEVFLKKNKYKAIASYVNSKAIKKDNIDVNVVVEEVEKYYVSMEKIQKYLSDMFGKNEYDENFIVQFIVFWEFIDSLSLNQMKYFKYFLDKLSVQRSQETFIKKVKSSLDAYKEEAYKTNDICNKLKNFNIIISGNDLMRKVELLQVWKLYLEEVDSYKEEIYNIFSKEATYDDVVKLIEIDQKYVKLVKDINKNNKEYEKYIGKYYKGLETAVNDIGQTIEHYGEFLRKVKNIALIEKVLQNDLNTLLEDTRKIEDLYFTWGHKCRSFSFCFKGGQQELYTNSFSKNDKLLTQFIEKEDQVDAILSINELTAGFLDFNLKDLYEGIRSCKYGHNIANRFIYTVYYKYYKEVLEEYPLLKTFDDVDKNIKDYADYEKIYCNKNLISLQLNAKTLKPINIMDNNLEFNQYDEIVKILSKNVFLYYANLGIFNSNMDLNLYDLVIIDDAHLSSANKYNRINECKQVIAFGNSHFHTSVSNALMTRLGDACKYELNRSYIKKNSVLNLWEKSNQYIYTLKNNINVVTKDDFNDFVKDVFERFQKNPNYIYNILVCKESTRRKIYTAIVALLANFYDPNEIMNIFCYNIRILNAPLEGNRYVNEVFIYYDDFINLENSVKELVYRNYLIAHNDVVIYLIKHKIENENITLKKEIFDTIKQSNIEDKSLSDISSRVKNALIKKGKNVENGFGEFDLILHAEKSTAIYIIGKENNYMVNFVDDYVYYNLEYQNRGWQVEVVYIVDLIENFDNTIDKLVENIG